MPATVEFLRIQDIPQKIIVFVKKLSQFYAIVIVINKQKRVIFMGGNSIKTAGIPSPALYKFMLFSFFAIAIYTAGVTAAYANPPAPADTPMGTVLCAVIGFVYGNMGRGLATLAIIIIGVGATLGKVSWGLAITVGVGISIIFNADGIMTQMTGNALNCPVPADAGGGGGFR